MVFERVQSKWILIFFSLEALVPSKLGVLREQVLCLAPLADGSWVFSCPLMISLICCNDGRPHAPVRFADVNSALATPVITEGPYVHGC